MTTYRVLVLDNPTDGVWRELGEIDAHSMDAARIALLTQHKLTDATAVAIPGRSWKPQRFKTQQTVRYVKGNTNQLTL